MKRSVLHALVANGDLARVREELGKAKIRGDRKLINTPDHEGYTPLMRAVLSDRAGVDIVGELVAHGARIVQGGEGADESKRDVVRLALNGGDPAKVKALTEAGADLRYRTGQGYHALLDAVHGRDVLGDARLIDLVNLLLDAGVEVNGESRYGETCLRALSRYGRFDGVKVLLDAGADRNGLQWSALHEAVALGALPDVEDRLRAGAPLEDVDHDGRTPWLLAVQSGDVAKAQALDRHGVNIFASGRMGRQAVHFALASRQAPMLRWLLDQGHDVEAADDLGVTALMEAAESGRTEAVEILLARGAGVDRELHGRTALSNAQSGEIVRCLLKAGADPQHLSSGGRRAALGFAPDPDPYALAEITDEAFLSACTPRFGVANPEERREPFLHAMVRSGVDAYRAKHWSADVGSRAVSPIWCARRFGQSFTFLQDGRVVEIAGEHEDYYDPDFCIYNDVFVHGPAGDLTILGYPASVFPPTDFHTATLAGDFIYVIGSLGYQNARDYGRTPVFRLDVRDWSFEEIHAGGKAPGWIHRHRARLIATDEIVVTDGIVLTGETTKEANTRVYVLDLKQSIWRASP